MLHVFLYMVMDYKIIVGQAPILFLNPSSSFKVLGLSRRNVFFNCIVLCPIFSYFFIFKWLLLLFDIKHFQVLTSNILCQAVPLQHHDIVAPQQDIMPGNCHSHFLMYLFFKSVIVVNTKDVVKIMIERYWNTCHGHILTILA